MLPPPHLNNTEGCKVSKKRLKAVKISVHAFRLQINFNLSSLGKSVAGRVSCVPKVALHGGQRTPDNIHGFGDSW